MPFVNEEQFELDPSSTLATYAYRFGVGLDVLAEAPGLLSAAFDFQAQPVALEPVGLSVGGAADGLFYAGLQTYRSDDATLAAALTVSPGRISGLLAAAFEVLKANPGDHPLLLALTVGRDGSSLLPAGFDTSGFFQARALAGFDLSAILRAALWQAFNVDSGATDIHSLLVGFSVGGYGSAAFYLAFDSEFGGGAIIVFVDLLDAALCAALGE
jgi:hypothetical protein